MKKHTHNNKHILGKINFIITILVIAANAVSFMFSDLNRTNFIIINLFLSVFLFFIHWIILSINLKENVNEIKREALYINYPINIATFFICLALIMGISAIFLFILNKEAMNLAFIFMFFMSFISMIFPSIILLVYIYFILPAFIVPGFSSNRKSKENTHLLPVILLVIFSLFCIYKLVNHSIRTINIEHQNKYQIIRLPIQYSTEYLKLEEISDYGKKKLSQVKFSVPFYYTAESFNFKEYSSAEIFCNSIGARIPNYLEMYNIAFNRFDIFGEKYYWTNNKDGRYPLLIQFKNMSYNVVKYDNDSIKPALYCVTDIKTNQKVKRRNYLYKNENQERANTLEDLVSKPFNGNLLIDILGKENKTDITTSTKTEVLPPDVNAERKHVNFSVKEVPSSIMNELIQKGYVYNTGLKINTKYETNDYEFASKIIRDKDKKNIRLCYYPFTDYSNLSMYNEFQIWSQSFCSPAFELIEPAPVLKNRYDKDAYCYSRGGRVPNIPELNGILKTLNINNTGTKYWTNNEITDNTSDSKQPVLVYYEDSRFMKVKALMQNENDSAYTYCIKNAQVPSKVIANYTSRFKGVDAKMYAKKQCPKCQYYGVPDTVLLKY